MAFKHRLFPILTSLILLSVHAVQAQPETEASQSADNTQRPDGPYVLVLGTAQDAGYPQAGCLKPCCVRAWKDRQVRRLPTSIAVVDPVSDQRFLFDCTWQFPEQWHLLQQAHPIAKSPGLDGIFLTHGHMGHYTGLMHLGREVIGADGVPVYAMPRMKKFLETNGPWSLLVKLNNIQIQPLADQKTVRLSYRISVTPISVPHRGEYTETVGFVISIQSPSKDQDPDRQRSDIVSRKILYLPDIDKWDRWEQKIETVLSEVDLAFLDATFFRNGEIPGRDMSEIPHPFIEESLLRFQGLDAAERDKIHFIHLNHTNPALDAEGQAAESIRRAGMHLAEQGQRY